MIFPQFTLYKKMYGESRVGMCKKIEVGKARGRWPVTRLSMDSLPWD